MMGSQLLSEEPLEISLCFSVEGKSRLVQKQNNRRVLVPYLSELNEEGEEPDEACATL